MQSQPWGTPAIYEMRSNLYSFKYMMNASWILNSNVTTIWAIGLAVCILSNYIISHLFSLYPVACHITDITNMICAMLCLLFPSCSKCVMTREIYVHLMRYTWVFVIFCCFSEYCMTYNHFVSLWLVLLVSFVILWYSVVKCSMVFLGIVCCCCYSFSILFYLSIIFSSLKWMSQRKGIQKKP